eukprot:SAG11_NODE_13_length_26388_cov_67.360341_14_plen_77_part_00
MVWVGRGQVWERAVVCGELGHVLQLQVRLRVTEPALAKGLPAYECGQLLVNSESVVSLRAGWSSHSPWSWRSRAHQ